MGTGILTCAFLKEGENLIYLDNAATSCPKPKNVINAVSEALGKMSANPGRSGHFASVRNAEAVYNVRKKVAEFFGSENPENVVFLSNCTEAINIVLKGNLSKNDHLIISNLEHNAVARPSYKLGEKGVEISVFDAFNDDIEGEIEKHLKNNTKMVFCTHASNVCGKVLPIEKIGKFCKKRGILFGVDAAQSAGLLPVNMKKYGIDFLCIAPHKGLFAPMGTGILIADSPIRKTIIEGGTGVNSMSLEQGDEMPEKFESGTVNFPGIMGISAGIDFIKARGTDKIYNHEISLCKRVHDCLKANPKIFVFWSDDEVCAPVISFLIKGVDSGIVAEKLNERGIAVRAGYHCSPFAHKTLGTSETGTVRISPGIAVNNRQIDYFCNVVNSIANGI